MEKILCPTIHVHRQHDCSYVDVGTVVCYTVSRSMFVSLPYHTYFLRASLVNVCPLDASAIKALLSQASTIAGSPAPAGGDDKKDDKNEFKISDGEKGRMKAMCGINSATLGNDAFPKWYRDIFKKNQD